MPLITVSRMVGAGGAELAARVAALLGWQLVDNELVGDNERDRFAGTSAVDTDGETRDEDRREDADAADRPRAAADGRDGVSGDRQDAPRR